LQWWQKKDDDNKKQQTNLLLLYAVDQASGNCATITKTTVGSTTSYSASGTGIPKGGCNEATLAPTYVTSSATAKTTSDTYYDALISLYNAGSSCSTLSTAASTNKSLITATTLETAANAASTKCISYANTGRNIYCTSESAVTTNKALTRYVSISSAATDMKTNFDGQKTSWTANISNSGFTVANIALAGVLSSANVSAASSNAYQAWINAYIASFSNTSLQTCAKSIVTNNTALKQLLLKSNGGTLESVTGITKTDAASVTPESSVSCGYGTGFTATTTTSVTIGSSTFVTAGVGTCPTSYTQF
jgi:hypothetical protein